MSNAADRSRCERWDVRPGAVIVGGDYQGLAIARSLGRRGVNVLVIDDERSVSRLSRYVEDTVMVRDLRTEEGTIDALQDAARRRAVGGWVVYPTRDETVAAISRHRDQLSEWLRIPTPQWEVTKWAWDKRYTYRRASDLGIPVPRTWNVERVAELEEIDAQPPFVIKPAIKEHFFQKTGCKAWRANTRQELKARFLQAAEIVASSGEVMVQELIPGNGHTQLAYCALFKSGYAKASMVARRLRQHPVEFGRASTFVQTIDLNELENLSTRFLRSIDFYGLVEMEYKLDERDGTIKLLDVNARTWGYHSLAQRAGVDFPYLLYTDQLGFSMPDGIRTRAGVSWVRLATDVPTACRELLARRLDWRTYVRSLRSADIESVFARDDPLPTIAELGLLPYLAVKRGL